MMNQYKTEIKWALIFVAMGLVWMMLERISGLHSTYIHLHPIYTNFIAIPAVLVYVLAIREKHRKDFHWNSTYKQRFLAGLRITLIVTLLSPLSQLITSYIITPDFFKNAITYSVENNYSSLEEARAYFNLKSYITQGVIFAPVMGILTTAITAIFFKNRPADD